MSNTLKILCDYLRENEFGVSIGGLGALAEYEDPDYLIVDSNSGIIISSENKKGAIKAEISSDFDFLAKEALINKSRLWKREIVITGKSDLRRMANGTLTEVGKDNGALKDEHKNHFLFDLGVGLTNSTFYIRTCHDELISLLRRYAGKKITETQHPVLEAIVDVSPTRVVSSKAGRIEVYQKISRVRTPSGPHTHLLPELLNSRKKQLEHCEFSPASLPVINFHPKRISRHGKKGVNSCENFDKLLKTIGNSNYYQAKTHAISGLLSDNLTTKLDYFQSTVEKQALKIALIQSKHYFPSGKIATKHLAKIPK